MDANGRGLDSAAAYQKVAVTGHRTLADGAHVVAELGRLAVKLRDDHATTVAISGMALGADTAWAHAGLNAGLELHAYIPFEEQASRWPAKNRAEWAELRAAATHEVIAGVSDGSRNVVVGLLHKRNDLMLRDCDLLVAVLDLSAAERTGGSWSAVTKYGRHSAGRPLVLVDASGHEPTRMITVDSLMP